MNFQVISLFPEMIVAGLKEGVVATALDQKIISLSCLNPRKFTSDAHHTVDDKPFGGGDGMLLMAEPIEQSLEHFRTMADGTGDIIFLSARGEVFTDEIAREFSQKKTLTLICGRYAGLDQRAIVKNNIREISIGDYILSGGELAALVLIDSISRHLPGVLGCSLSAKEDSFSNGLLEAPSFTRTRNWSGLAVPSTLLCGDHKKIKEWKDYLAVFSTLSVRDDLFWRADLDVKFLKTALEFFLKMEKSELAVCGLSNPNHIASTLEIAIQRKSK